MKPETPRPLSEAAAAYYGWLIQRLTQTSNEWQPVDGTLLATLAELLELQEQLAEALQQQPLNPTYTRLRLQLSAQIACYSRLLGLCPKHRNQLRQEPADLAKVAEELGLDLELIRQLTPAV
jgi:hypothetical protein